MTLTGPWKCYLYELYNELNTFASVPDTWVISELHSTNNSDIAVQSDALWMPDTTCKTMTDLLHNEIFNITKLENKTRLRGMPNCKYFFKHGTRLSCFHLKSSCLCVASLSSAIENTCKLFAQSSTAKKMPMSPTPKVNLSASLKMGLSNKYWRPLIFLNSVWFQSFHVPTEET